jgi:hypothetical protein
MKSDFEAFGATALVVLLTLILYNSFVKAFTPTPIRNLIGLG